jgi:hypothetical protein
MTPNVGTTDRFLRALVGIVLVALPFVSAMAMFESGPAKWLSVAIGLVLLATSTMRFCPAYKLLGLKTCKDC